MIHREPLEWTRTWWEQSESDLLPRALLIGDSIVCGYRDYVQKELNGKAYVDQFATSKFISDPFFQKELSLYLDEYKYSCIHFNHGLHGRDFSDDEYSKYYEETLKLLLTKCDKVILVLSTPITQKNNPGQLDELNDVVKRRNNIVKALAEKYSLPIDNLYDVMEAHPEYKLNDGYHYNDDGKIFQAKLVAQSIQPFLK